MAQVVKADRGLLARGMSAGHIPHGSGAGTGGKAGSPKGSGGGGGGGSGKSTMDSFGPESETLPGFQLGPFILSEPKASSRATAAQKAHAEAMDQMQQVYGKALDQNGGDPRAAMLAVMRDPQTRGFLVSHPDMLGASGDAMHKVLGKGDAQKPYKITNEGQAITGDGQGGYTAQDIPGFRGPTPGTIEKDEDGNYRRTPGSRSSAAPGMQFQPQGQTPQGQAKIQSEIDKNNAQTGLTQSKTEGQDQKNADPYAGKPYKISKDDGDLISAAPSILGSMDILRRWAPDANGLLTGPAGQLAAKVFGTNDASQVWGAAKNALTQSLMMGHVPSGYAGTMKQFLQTLPQSWENARFNTTELAASSAAIRQTVNARLANVEQENGGRPYTPANQNNLREVGIIPPSAGWDNPVALSKAGPDGLKNASDEQLMWLKDHQHMLSPAEKAAGKAEAMRRAGMVAPQQGQPAPDQQPQQQQQEQPAPGGQAPPEPPPQPPQEAQGAPGQQSQDTSPYAPDPRLAQASPDAGDEETA